MTARLVVIGGDAAGMTAAATARRRRSVDELEIVAFERGEFTSYSACGIPYFVGDLIDDPETLVARSPEEHRKRGIDARTGQTVTKIDLDRRAVAVEPTAGGASAWEPFDQLVVATGSTPVRPPIPGIDAEGIFGVQTLDDGVALRAAVDRLVGDARRAVVVGGGYVGLELAEALVMRGLEVTLVEGAAQPMSTLDPDMGELIADALRKSGVDLHVGAHVESFDVEDGRVRAVRTQSAAYPADIVVLGLGTRPNSALAADAGIAVGEKTRGIVTDDHMRTSADGVWAAGDCVETVHLVSMQPVAIALGTHANKQGRVVGVNATGGDESFPGVLGTAVSKLCKYEVARTGLGEQEAADAGYDAVVATVDATTRAAYFPGASPIRLKGIAERDSGIILGTQIVGEEGAAKRIDVLATAIWNRMTAGALVQVDLSYAPPVAPLWDPVLVLARRLAAKATGAPD